MFDPKAKHTVAFNILKFGEPLPAASLVVGTNTIPHQAMPQLAGFALDVYDDIQCCQYTLSNSDGDMFVGGLAWGPGHGRALWQWLHDYRDYVTHPVVEHLRGRNPDMPPTPWLAVVSILNPDTIGEARAQFILDWQSQLASTIMRYYTLIN